MAKVFRDDLRTDWHSCEYRKTPHRIFGGCGCFCDLCLKDENDKLSDAGDSPLESENE